MASRSKGGDYSAAPTSESGGKVEIVEAGTGPDQVPQTPMQKCAFYTCWLGFAFIFAGCIW